MYRIALCDDNPHQTDELSDIITNFLCDRKINFIIDVYDSGELLLQAIQEYDEQYQILLLDIQMKATDGIETAKIIRKSDDDILISYITSYDKYTLESFAVSPFRYLLKPVSQEKIEELMELSIEAINKKCHYLFFTIGQERHQVKTAQIMTITSVFGRKIRLELNDEPDIEFYRKIRDIEKEVDSFTFVKANSGTIVNLNYIRSITTQDIVQLKNGRKITISRGRKKDFRRSYYHFMEKMLL